MNFISNLLVGLLLFTQAFMISAMNKNVQWVVSTSSPYSASTAAAYASVTQSNNALWISHFNDHRLEGKYPLFPIHLSVPSPILPSIPVAQSSIPSPSSVVRPAILPVTYNNSFLSTNTAALSLQGYQQQVESSQKHNTARFQGRQIEHLHKQLQMLFNQPGGREIFNNRQKAMITDFDHVLHTLRGAVQTPSNSLFNSPVGIAQITHNWLQLSQLKLSNPALNEELQGVIKIIQQMTIDPATHAFDPTQLGINGKHSTVTKVINSFEGTLKDWVENPVNVQQQALQDVQNYFSRYGSYSSHPELQRVEAWQFLTAAQEGVNPIAKSAHTQNLSRMVELCKNGQFTEARELALQYPAGPTFLAFHAIHETSFAQQYTPEDINKLYVNDPLYVLRKHELVKTTERNLLSKPHPFNSHLAERHELYTNVTQKLKLINPAPHTQQLIYHVVGKELSNPHVTISPCKTFIGLASFEARAPEQLGAVERGMNHLQRGLSDHPNAAAHLRLAHETNSALRQPGSDQRVLELADYSMLLDNAKHAHIQECAVSYIVDNFDKNWEGINRVDRAYRALQAGDIRGEYYLLETFKTSVNPHVLAVGHDAPMPYFAGIRADAVAAHVQESKNVTQVLLHNGAELQLKHYETLPAVNEFLIKNGLDPEKYGRLNGTLDQHVNHADILRQIVKQKDLSGLQLLESSNLHQLLKLSTQVTDLSREHNTVGDIMQSSVLSNFCWQTLGYIEKASKFGIDTGCSFTQGTIQGIRSTIHTFTHPRELVCNLRDLGLAMFKIMYTNEEIDRRFSVFNTPEQNEHMIRELIREDQPIFEAIRERVANATFQDFVREGTAVAVDCLLTKRTFTTLGEIAKVAQVHGQQLAQRIAQSARIPEIVVTTAEGLQVKVPASAAAAASETAVLREASQAIKNASNNLINWTNHGFKHFPQKGLSWGQIIESTKQVAAKYKPGINIEALERMAWEKGIQTTNQKPWKVMKFDTIIGAKNGIETSCMRIEFSANTIHGHPITALEYLELLK